MHPSVAQSMSESEKSIQTNLKMLSLSLAIEEEKTVEVHHNHECHIQYRERKSPTNFISTANAIQFSFSLHRIAKALLLLSFSQSIH